MPDVIVEKASAKLNLALHVLGRRLDGYHELDSLVVFADIADGLRIEESTQTSLSITGPFAKALAADETNIVLKAVRAATKLYSDHGVALPPIKIALEKNLPVASGIGGGSADAAATIRALMRLAKTDLPRIDVQELALSLGADVPVCLSSHTCRMRGMGDNIEYLPRPPAPAVVLVNPMHELSTKAVFEKLGLKPGDAFSESLDVDNPSQWRNDLSAPARALLPAIDEVLASFRGGMPSGMSGSGATCFALAESVEAATAAAHELALRYPAWWVMAGRIF
jgi:4-diphosphocytidyl-2-C-methyl-D-erythritol kinase